MLSREELRSILEDNATLKLSFYLPTARKDVATMQGPIRLKNLIRECEGKLAASGTAEDEIKHLLKPLRELAGDFGYWQHQKEGLALLRSHDRLTEFRIPLAVPEVAEAGPRYHIKPLLSWMAGDGEFYILAISLNGVLVLRATKDTAETIALPEDMPEKLERPGDQPGLQARSSGPGQPGYHGAIVHGSSGDERDLELEKFLRGVSTGMAAIVKAGPGPVVLMATDSVASDFRKLYRGAELLAEGISGSPEGITGRKLQEKAWPIAEQHFAAATQAAAARIEERLHSRQASNEIQAILIAATEGRIAALFVPLGKHLMGRFDGTAVTLDGDSANNEDLLDLAAARAYASGADVYAVPPGSVPGKGEIAAQFRY